MGRSYDRMSSDCGWADRVRGAHISDLGYYPVIDTVTPPTCSYDEANEKSIDILARREPIWFMHRLDKRRFTPRHLRLISRKISEGVRKGGYRGIFCAPPRHGKSDTISLGTPAWFLNEWPEKRVIECAYGDSFAAEWGEKVRDLLAANEAKLRVRLKRSDKGAVDNWDTTAGGGMKTAG